LSSCGAEVRIAGSAAQALEVLTQWRTDVLVTDIGMPGEDGYGLLTKVRGQQGELARLPAVALTAYASRDDRIRLLSAGFQAHVPKPVDPEELVTVVANLGRTARRA
ncbi:MAG: response regulator, partial [Deltaproteobacteria bacterium]